MNRPILFFILYFVASVCEVPFVYTNPNDPTNVAKLHEALMQIGISPDDIQVVTFIEKSETLLDAYKATYWNQQGQKCYLKWHVGVIFGTPSLEMPICVNMPIGGGSPVIVVPSTQSAIYPPPARRSLCPPAYTMCYTEYDTVVPVCEPEEVRSNFTRRYSKRHARNVRRSSKLRREPKKSKRNNKSHQSTRTRVKEE